MEVLNEAWFLLEFTTTTAEEASTVADAEDKWLAFSITVISGCAALVGALSICCIKKSQFKYVIPIVLLFSAGVLIHLSFMDLVGHSQENFQYSMGADVMGHDHDHGHDSHDDHDDHDHDHRRRLLDSDSHLDDEEIIALSHVYTLLCVVVGILSMLLLEKLSHHFGHDHQNEMAENPHYGSLGSTEMVENMKQQSAYPALDDATNTKQQKHSSLEGKADHPTVDMKRLSCNIAIAIILHHFPEGIATYVALVYEFEFGVLVAFALAIHDIPCGMALASTVCFRLSMFLNILSFRIYILALTHLLVDLFRFVI